MGGEDDSTEYEGLPLTETTVCLPLPKKGGKEVSVKLVHVQDPKTSNFSLKKKQCDLWEYVWGSSILMSGVLAQMDMSGLNVLELGCGQGLCSITAALSGATVLATDLVEDAVKLVERSAERNAVKNMMTFQAFSWNKRESLAEAAYDVVLGSDVLFFNGTISPVAHSIDKALKSGGVALVVDPFRLGVDDFVDKLESLGLKAEVLLFSENAITNVTSTEKAVVKAKKAKLVLITKPLQEGDQAIKQLTSFVDGLRNIIPEFTSG